MKELQFVESDLEYQSEILNISDIEFLKSVSEFVSKYPELEEIYYSKKEKLDKVMDESEISLIDVEKLEIPQAKNIYRTIVKTTHPDKVNNEKLNSLYKEATEAYNNGDLISLYKVSTDLGIQFDFNDDLIDEIRDKIKKLRLQTKMLESTFTFKWIKSNNDDEKNQIILEFIKSRIK